MCEADTSRLENYFCGIGCNCPRIADSVRRAQILQFNAGSVLEYTTTTSIRILPSL